KSNCTTCDNVTEVFCALKSRKPSKTPPTLMTKFVIFARRLQAGPNHSNDEVRSTVRFDNERDPVRSKMRKVWSKHAARHRSLRELPLARGIGSGWRGISGCLRNRTRRGGCPAQALALRQLRNSRADWLRRYGRDLSRQATTFPAHRRGKARP